MSSAETGLSAEDLELLTPEERAAIEDGADDAAEQEALARLAAQAPDDDDDDEDDDGEDSPVVATDETQAPSPAPTTAPASAPEPIATDKPAPTTYAAELPADFEAKQSAVKDKLGDLRKAFREGALEVDEYEAQREVLERERDELNTARTKAEISSEMRQQDAANAWQAAINKAFDDAATAAGGGIDYRKDAAKAADLDAFVRRLGDDPANADKGMEWFLAEGHRRVRALHGVAAAPVPVPTAAPRRAPVELAPKTLAQVPGADGPGDVSGEFADMDALDGDELEIAISRLSPVQLDKYMRGR